MSIVSKIIFAKIMHGHSVSINCPVCPPTVVAGLIQLTRA